MRRFVCAVLDTETTGFYYNGRDRLVEVAAVKIRDGEIKEDENFSTLLNPERPIPPAATRVNKIVDSMVQEAPFFAEIADSLIDFLSDVDYLFIHNAKFDLGFLNAEMKRCGKKLKLPKIICSVELSRKLYPEFKGHNLNVIAKRLGLFIKTGENRHRALGDVIMTGQAILKFQDDNPLTFLGTLESLVKTEYC
jgi:DNA polymerase III epsilon subunit